ncbi:hypothetical protein Hanom_Chr14g01260641 [Helianthus anomalus]
MELDQLGSSLVNIRCIGQQFFIQRVPDIVALFLKYFNLTSLGLSSRSFLLHWLQKHQISFYKQSQPLRKQMYGFTYVYIDLRSD